MAVVVHTANSAYEGPDRLDVTRAGCDEVRQRTGEPAPGEAFAPPFRLLARVGLGKERIEALRRDGHAKSARLLEIEAFRAYARQYKEEMLRSFDCRRADWRALLERPRVVLVCGCRSELCHRALLAEILVRHGAEDGGELLEGVTLVPRGDPAPPVPPSAGPRKLG
jgi:hypothetical protein